jgi:P-type conjugative transfer protein TrbJ
MKKKAFLTAILLITFFTFLNPVPGRCSGIPNVDIARFLQNLARYLYELKQYAEILDTHATKAAHLLTAIQMFDQKMREYQNYLSELEALKDQISREDWWAINEAIKRNLRRLQSLRKKYLDSADTQAANAEKDVDEMLGNYETVPMKEEEVSENMSALGIESDELKKSAARDRENYLLKKERMMDAADFEQESRSRREIIDTHQKIVKDRLGSKSTLATDQAIAAQGWTRLNQREALIRTKIRILQNLKTRREMISSQDDEMRRDEFERLKNFEPAKPYGSDRFGEL